MWQREELFQFLPGMTVDDIPKGMIPITTMESFRQLDYVIPGGISYERTAYTFLAQLQLSEKLNVCNQFEDGVVLLNEEGALVRHDGVWDLIFTTDKLEQNTINEESDLYAVFEQIVNELKAGRKSWIRLDKITLRSLLKNQPNLDILDNYCRKYPGGYLEVARKIVINGPDELYANVPVCRFGALTAVDLEERENYNSINLLMQEYIYTVDNSGGAAQRPLCIAVFGAPGSGKSFGVKQIAKSYGRYDIFTLNLSQYKSYDEMLSALDTALKSAQNIPLVFFDEFDCEFNGTARGWLKYLLAPMQDGEYIYRSKIETIQNAVFVFAGGTASSFKQFLPADEEQKEIFKAVKGPDFVSRLKGILNIKGPNPSSITDKAFIIRRAILLRDMIKRKVPQIYDFNTGIVNISSSLLSALLRTKEYRHGTRSMEFVLDMSRLSGVTKFTPSCLPLQHQLDIHLDYMDLSKKLAVERVTSDSFESYVERSHTYYRNAIRKKLRKEEHTEEEIKKIFEQDPSLKTWDRLEEERRELYRIRLRALLEAAEGLDFKLGVRPAGIDTSDIVTNFNDSELDSIAEIDHSAWLRSMLEDGWHYGPVEDKDIKISPDIRSYIELSEDEKELKRAAFAKMPKHMLEIGLVFYRKNY